jgi:hypothetical protein
MLWLDGSTSACFEINGGLVVDAMWGSQSMYASQSEPGQRLSCQLAYCRSPVSRLYLLTDKGRVSCLC